MTRYGSFAAIAAARCGRERARASRASTLGRMDARFVREPIAQRRVVRGRERDVAGQRAEVEAGTADDDRAPAARVDRVDRRAAASRDETRGRIPLVRVEKADEMMRDARALARARRRRADRHAAIDLPRVRADDLGVETLRELERERALAGRGLPGEDQNAGRHTRLNSRASARVRAARSSGGRAGSASGSRSAAAARPAPSSRETRAARPRATTEWHASDAHTRWSASSPRTSSLETRR